MENDPKQILIGPWLPDLPDILNPGSVNARNVYAKTDKSYGPVASPTVFSNALGLRCQGAAAFFDPSGNVHLFAGTATKLYHLAAGSVAWTDVSKVGGYHLAVDEMWQFEYANGVVTATNILDPIQAYTLGVSALFADLAAAAPRARYSAWIANFHMVGNTNDGTFGLQGQRVWWPALNDATNWPTPGTQAAAQFQSSYNDLFGRHGFVNGMVGNLGSADGAIFMQEAVFRVNYVGPPGVFQFPPAEGVLGCVAPNSIVHYGDSAYYLGPDDFYMFDGATSVSISGDAWGKTFYTDVDSNYIFRVQGTVDPINKQIIWAYAGQGNVGGVPNRVIFYNWFLKRATICEITCEVICRMLSVGYTLDQLFTVFGYTLDNLPAPLDSRVWTGGNLLLGIFDNLHQLNFLTGPNLAPTVDTMEIQPFPGRKFKSNTFRPLVDGGVPSISLGYRDRQQDPVVFTPAVPMNALGVSPIRRSARYGRARITLPAASVFQHIYGVEIDGVVTGNR